MVYDQYRHFVRPVRGMFDPALLRQLRQEYDALKQDGVAYAGLSEREQRMESIGATRDSIRMRERWYDIWRGRPGQLEQLRPFTYVTYPLQIRYLTKAVDIVPWHQDEGYMKLLPARHTQVITCWTPLEDRPYECTGLMFARGHHWPELEHHGAGPHGACLADEDFPDFYHERLELGDCMLFGDLVPHKTLMAPHLKTERHSFEIRLVMPEHALPGKDYFDLETGRFIKT